MEYARRLGADPEHPQIAGRDIIGSLGLIQARLIFLSEMAAITRTFLIFLPQFDANGGVGQLNGINFSYNVGASGTSTGTVYGFNAFHSYLHVYTGMTLTGPINAHSSFANIDTGSIATGANWNSYTANEQINVPIQNYTGLNIANTIAEITNYATAVNVGCTWTTTNGFNGVNINMNCTTGTGFSAFFNTSGTLGAMQSVYGLNYSANITSISQFSAGVSVHPSITSYVGSGGYTGVSVDMTNVPVEADGRKHGLDINQGVIGAGMD